MKTLNRSLFVVTTGLLCVVLSASNSLGQTSKKPKYATDIPPSITTPDSVNTRLGTLRFFDVRFSDHVELEKTAAEKLDSDGRIVVILPGRGRTVRLMKAHLNRFGERTLLLCVPPDDRLANLALEMAAIEWVERNTPELVQSGRLWRQGPSVGHERWRDVLAGLRMPQCPKLRLGLRPQSSGGARLPEGNGRSGRYPLAFRHAADSGSPRNRSSSRDHGVRAAEGDSVPPAWSRSAR